MYYPCNARGTNITNSLIRTFRNRSALATICINTMYHHVFILSFGSETHDAEQSERAPGLNSWYHGTHEDPTARK